MLAQHSSTVHPTASLSLEFLPRISPCASITRTQRLRTLRADVAESEAAAVQWRLHSDWQHLKQCSIPDSLHHLQTQQSPGAFAAQPAPSRQAVIQLDHSGCETVTAIVMCMMGGHSQAGTQLKSSPGSDTGPPVPPLETCPVNLHSPKRTFSQL